MLKGDLYSYNQEDPYSYTINTSLVRIEQYIIGGLVDLSKFFYIIKLCASIHVLAIFILNVFISSNNSGKVANDTFDDTKIMEKPQDIKRSIHLSPHKILVKKNLITLQYQTRFYSIAL